MPSNYGQFRQPFTHSAVEAEAQPARSKGTNGDAPAAEMATHLPDAFWRARSELTHISRAARSRMISRDALLGAALARVAALSSHNLRIPTIVGHECGLTFYIGLVGPSGASKSSAAAEARDQIPCPTPEWVADMLPIGSGEGLVECLFDVVEQQDEDGRKTKVKTQTRFGAFVYIDEGAVLGELAQRRGSTLLPTLRAAYTHGTLGQTNATAERRRVVEGSRYVYGLVLGIQPELAGPILDDAAAGTPQRFVWFSAIDPDMPDEADDWPGALRWRRLDAANLSIAEAIRDEVRADRVAVMRGAARDPLNAHRMLVRLKVAALLALLGCRTVVGAEDWRLAGIVMDTSQHGSGQHRGDPCRRRPDPGAGRHRRTRPTRADRRRQ